MDHLEEHQEEGNNPTSTLTVTVGDLISAIAEAAEEATIGDEHIAHLTHAVLHNMLSRRK